MQRARGDVSPIQFVHLVLHQRDERRDNERRARQHHRRELIPERLAEARRHDREHVASAQHGSHDAFLCRTEPAVTEMLAEDGGKIVWWVGERCHDLTTTIPSSSADFNRYRSRRYGPGIVPLV